MLRFFLPATQGLLKSSPKIARGLAFSALRTNVASQTVRASLLGRHFRLSYFSGTDAEDDKESPQPEESAAATESTVPVVEVLPPYLTDALLNKINDSKPLRKTLSKIKDVTVHTVTGMKLLCADTKIAFKLFRRMIKGQTLTRREHKLLHRVTSDIFRVVPVAVFVVVPFLEFALPFALKMFPQMLPSVFVDQLKKEADLKRSLRVKIEMARFLNDAFNDLASQLVNRKVPDADSFKALMRKTQNGEAVTTDEILSLSQLFRDEITLDNLPRTQLVSMSRFLGLASYGTDAFLRFQLRHKVRRIKADDRVGEEWGMIIFEGVDSLSFSELQAANRARGMNFESQRGRAVLRRQLLEWLDLSQAGVSISLLLLSRIFTFSSIYTNNQEEALRVTLSGMSREVIEEVEAEVAKNQVKTTYKNSISTSERMLTSVLNQTQLIEQEAQDKYLTDLHKDTYVNFTVPSITSTENELKIPSADEQPKPSESERIKAKDLAEAEEAVLILASESAVDEERADLANLRLEYERANEIVKDSTERLKKQTKSSPSLPGTVDSIIAPSVEEVSLPIEVEEIHFSDVSPNSSQDTKQHEHYMGEPMDTSSPEGSEETEKEDKPVDKKTSKAANRLSRRLEFLLTRLGEEMTEIDSSISRGLNLINVNQDGKVTVEELGTAIRMLKEERSKGQISEIIQMIPTGDDGKIDLIKLKEAANVREALMRDLDDLPNSDNSSTLEESEKDAAAGEIINEADSKDPAMSIAEQ